MSAWLEYKTNYYTAFRLWNGGLSNQIMSLEIAIGISYILNNNVHVHDARPLSSHSKTFEEKNNFITDFIDLSYFKNLHISKESIDKPLPRQNRIKNLMNKFIYVKESLNNVNDFAEGREGLFIEPEKTYCFDNTLSYYSIMFFNRTNQFESYIRQLKFKKEYIDLANFISAQIGNFSGIHLRQTDFVKTIYSVKKEEYDHALQKLKQNSNLIIVCTDDSKSLITQNQNNVIFVDDLIKNNFMREFSELTVTSKISFDLICMLIMYNSVDFIGTIGSTYSGLIHRNVNQAKNNTHHWTNMGDYDNIAGFPFSWNSYKKISIGKKLWWREWKESYIG